MGVDRRQFLVGTSIAFSIPLAGCTGEGGGGSGGGSSNGGGSTGQECRYETRTHEEGVVDEWDNYGAGQSISWRFDLERDDVLIIEATKTDGARPSLTIEDPSGNTILDMGPEERIRYRLTADRDGRYYVQFYNEALATTGQWDIDITYRTEYEEEVCE